jgi:hypothetical protein
LAVIQSGDSSDLGVVDATFKSLRVSNRPVDPGTLGSYRQSLFSGAVTAGLAANSEVMQFRYTGANLAIVNQVKFLGVAASTAFAAGAMSFRLLLATSWSADGSGGNVLTVSGGTSELDSSYASSVATLRVIDQAALGVGTKTLQGVTSNRQGIGVCMGFTAPATPAVGQQMAPDFLFETQGLYAHPQVLRQNEGLVVVATVPGTGVWLTGFTVDWDEVTVADWRS